MNGNILGNGRRLVELNGGMKSLYLHTYAWPEDVPKSEGTLQKDDEESYEKESELKKPEKNFFFKRLMKKKRKNRKC